MSRPLVLGVAFLVGAVVGGIAGVLIYLNIVGGTGEPSAPISAPTLSLERATNTPTPLNFDVLAADVAGIGTQLAALSTAVNDSAVQQREAVSLMNTEIANIGAGIGRLRAEQIIAQAGGQTGAASAPTTARTPRPTNTPRPMATLTITPTPSITALPNQVLFRISSRESEARFILDELEPFVMGLVGSTSQVAGDIIVDFDNPQHSRLGVVRINLRTLRTDSPNRDQAIRGEVLLSARPEYEFTNFTPTQITGLPDSITIGETVSFQITGDLPLRGITRSVTFDTSVTVVNEIELRGLTRTTILRADYGMLQGFLSERGVSEEIILELEFVARAVRQ